LRDANGGAIKQTSLLGGRIIAFDDDYSEAKKRNRLVAGFISRPAIVSFKIERTIRRLGSIGSSHVGRQQAELGMYRVAHRRSEHDLYGELAQMSGRYGLRQAFIKMTRDTPDLLDTLVRHPSAMIVVGVGAFLFISEAVGTAQELPTGTNDPSDRPAMERSGLDGIGATATQSARARTSPGRWLIDDVARERAEFELRQVGLQPFSATNAGRDAAQVEAGGGSDDRRAGGERRAEGVTDSIGALTAERSGLSAAPSQRTLKRSDGVSPRPDTSRELLATKCIESPVGAAPEGEHWHYRLDRETHRKCWHVGAIREDRAEPGIVESDRPKSEPTPPALLDSAWAWWLAMIDKL
jgi:hypothetical protein